MRTGRVRCIIATQLADEGLDIQRLSRVLLAFPQRAKGPTIQRVGRLMRVFEEKGKDGVIRMKKPKLFDFVDNLVPTLRSRGKSRRSAYKDIGIL